MRESEEKLKRTKEENVRLDKENKRYENELVDKLEENKEAQNKMHDLEKWVKTSFYFLLIVLVVQLIPF